MNDFTLHLRPSLQGNWLQPFRARRLPSPRSRKPARNQHVREVRTLAQGWGVPSAGRHRRGSGSEMRGNSQCLPTVSYDALMSAVDTPSPLRVLDALNSFQRTYALKAAIELDLFRHIAAGATRAPELAARVQASDKGVRVLCDYLTICGFLRKQGDEYSLAADTALFLDSRSPAYVGTGVFFLAHPRNVAFFADLTEAVRRGGTAHGRGNLDAEAPIWVDFARWMAPLSAIAAG